MLYIGSTLLPPRAITIENGSTALVQYMYTYTSIESKATNLSSLISKERRAGRRREKGRGEEGRRGEWRGVEERGGERREGE